MFERRRRFAAEPLSKLLGIVMRVIVHRHEGQRPCVGRKCREDGVGVLVRKDAEDEMHWSALL